MRTKLANWTRLAVVVVVVAGTQTGCKSGWKMPGSDMFAWSRKPSESTLAGSSPSLSMPSSSNAGPISPALRGSPSTLASSAANPSRPSPPYGATNSATGPSFNMPPNNAMATMGGAGSAAAQNGYTNGPYGMVSSPTRPNGYASPSGYTAPSGYGAPQTAVASNAPIGFGPSGPAANTLAINAASMPPAYGGQGQGMPMPPAQLPSQGYAPLANNGGVPALPASFNPAAAMGGQNPSSMPNAFPGGAPSSMPSFATQRYEGASPYRPGSVGRSTGYDFSSQGSGSFANSGPSGQPMGLPPSAPSTANGQPFGMPSSQPATMYR